jgi:hypothetical protein
MGKSRILWDNAVTRSVINASAETSGYPDDNVATWRETSIWKASGDNDYTFVFEFTESAGETVKAFALMAHNLNTCGARFKVEGLVSPDSSELQATPLVPYEYPADDFCLVKFFTGGVFSEVHLHIDNNGGANFSPQIGIVFLGDYLEIPRNPDPNGLDPDKCEEIGDTQVSESGILLGESISFVKRSPSFSYPYLDPSFMTTWKSFRQDHRGKPFFWTWDSAKPAESYLMKFSSKTLTQPYYAVLYRSLQFDLEGRKEQ